MIKTIIISSLIVTLICWIGTILLRSDIVKELNREIRKRYGTNHKYTSNSSRTDKLKNLIKFCILQLIPFYNVWFLINIMVSYNDIVYQGAMELLTAYEKDLHNKEKEIIE